MIRKLSHTTVYVLDQDRAKAFYTEKLGFTVRNDVKMGNFRWLTVSPPEQSDVEIVLMPVAGSPMMDEATKEALRAMVEKGTFGCGVLQTADCKKTYEELSAKGVKFSSPPEVRPYGIEAMLKDDSGNWFSLTQTT